MTEFRIDADGQLATDPGEFDQAVELIRTRGLPGLWVRPDWRDKDPDAPLIELGRLPGLPSLRSFGISESVALKRVRGWEALAELAGLEKLAIYRYPDLDLRWFPRLETLMIRDSPRLRGLSSLTALRTAWITGLANPDLSALAEAPLSSVHLIRAKPTELLGLDRLSQLADLRLSYSTKLARLGPLPRSLQTLRIEGCAKLRDLDELRGNQSIERLWAAKLDHLAFVPSMARLEWLGFGDLVDGDLSWILASASLRRVSFADKRRHSHTLAEIEASLAERVERDTLA